jgi:DNA-binding protein HU-beta
MQKKELIEKFSEKIESTKAEAEKNFNAVFEFITELLIQGEEVAISGFGKFVAQGKSARKGRNPGTGKEIDIPAKTVPVFKAASQLKDKIDKETPQKKK